MIAFTSIVVATVATMIAVGVQDDYHGKRFATREVAFDEAFLAVTDIVFAYSEIPQAPNSSIVYHWLDTNAHQSHTSPSSDSCRK